MIFSQAIDCLLQSPLAPVSQSIAQLFKEAKMENEQISGRTILHLKVYFLRLKFKGLNVKIPKLSYCIDLNSYVDYE